MIPGIGNTPLVQLKRLTTPEMAEVWVKVESANPTGSMKDRMGLAIVEGAIRRGDLKPGGTMMDYTGGSTGSAIAMVCARLGYRSHFVSSNAFDASKLNTMRAFGAQLDLLEAEGKTITPDLFPRMFARVDELRSEPGYVWVDQFNNRDSLGAYERMAREIESTLGTVPDAFVMAVGTGGCFVGNAEYFKSVKPEVFCVAVEPATSQPLAGKKPTGGHRMEGMGVGYVTPLMRLDLVDSTFPVTDDEAADMARTLARKEGLFGGYSAGGNVAAALHLAKELGPGKRVVTVLCDSGLRYLSGDLFAFSGK